MYKTPYPLLRGVRGGTRCINPFTVFNTWNRSTDCRTLNNTRALSRESRIGVPFVMVWRWSIETFTVQYIIYNIKRDARKLASSCENPQPTQNTSPSRPPHHQYADPGADSLNSPHLRINYSDLGESSCPGRISDHVFTPTRTRIWLPVYPSRSGSQPVHPTLLPLIDVW